MLGKEIAKGPRQGKIRMGEGSKKIWWKRRKKRRRLSSFPEYASKIHGGEKRVSHRRKKANRVLRNGKKKTWGRCPTRGGKKKKLKLGCEGGVGGGGRKDLVVVKGKGAI